MPSPRTVHIAVLAFPGCLRSGAVVPADVFRIANTVAPFVPEARALRFECAWVGVRGEPSVEIGGLRFQLTPLEGCAADALLMPGIDHGNPAELPPLLAALGPERDALLAYAASGRLLATGCSSVSLLAEAGLLDGRRCTTSWWLAPTFRKRYPAVLFGDELVVCDGNLVTSGGVTSYFDLALWLVGHFGGENLRALTARFLVTDASRASQAPYVADAMLQGNGHALVERARRWLNQRLDGAWSMADLAAHCHTSPRTLLRRFQETLGVSPVQYAQQLRVERAKALLESTLLSLAEITGRCGYEDAATFSKVFKRWTSLTPREYRARFCLRQ